ncbi:MAG: riboflavin synthase [Acidimicrobiia bacterium]
MFTGIITEVGTVTAIEPTDGGARLVIRAPHTVAGAAVGDSIAVNGVCLTATEISPIGFTCDAIGETLGRSALADLTVEGAVNLERPMVAMGRFDGHIVQGHVDGVGTISGIESEGEARRLRIQIPPVIAPYTVEKGSIAVDGVSLTLTAVSEPGEPDPWIEVALIPHTMTSTVFGKRSVGDRVNLEVDIVAKYVERLLGYGP